MNSNIDYLSHVTVVPMTEGQMVGYFSQTDGETFWRRVSFLLTKL